MKQIRQLHLYLGTFFAPAIIFFALTGAVQTFQFHEEHEGRPAVPIFEKLAEIHKDQRVPKWSKPPAAAVAQPSATPATSPEASSPATPGVQSEAAVKPPQQKPSNGPPRTPRRKPSMPFKIFAGFMSIGLMGTTLLGIYMSFKYSRDQRVVWAMLVLGTVLPIALLYL